MKQISKPVLGRNPNRRHPAFDCSNERPARLPASRSALPITAPLRIIIEATPSGRKWRALFNSKLVCISAWPFVMAARQLLAAGHPPDSVIEMWRPGTSEWALRGRLGAVASTVIDGETASSRAKNGSPVRSRGVGRG
jgi:hypothetical protein